MNDAESQWAAWMREANSGNARSYRLLLEAVLIFLRRFVSHRASRAGVGAADCEDIVQEILLAVHLKRGTWNSERPLTPWLMAIARNKLIDALRHRGRRTLVPIEGLEDTLVLDESESSVLPHQTDRLLSVLKGKQRDVVFSPTIDDLSVEETAIRLSMSTGAVRVALHRGLETLSLASRKYRE